MKVYIQFLVTISSREKQYRTHEYRHRKAFANPFLLFMRTTRIFRTCEKRLLASSERGELSIETQKRM